MPKINRVLTVEESMKRMKENGVGRIIISYKDSSIGKRVLSFENGRFNYQLVLKNNPKLVWTFEISHTEGINIIKNIVSGMYRLQSYMILPIKNKQEQQKEKSLLMLI